MRTYCLPAIAVLLALTLCGASSAFTRSAAPDPAAAVGRITQSHGGVALPLIPCGIRVAVEGSPGSAYAVYVLAAGQPSLRVSAGVLPPTGAVTHAVYDPACHQDGPWSRAHVVSISDAPIRADVTFW